MIKKFKNGNILLDYSKEVKEKICEKNVTSSIDSIYHDDMFFNDLSFNRINGYMYLVDYNTRIVYDFSQCYINILQYLANELIENNYKLKLYPLGKKLSKSLIQDMENGY